MVEGKEAAVEKVNSMKENADEGITSSPVRKNSNVFNPGNNVNMVVFYLALIMMTTLQALEATWFGVGSSGKGELDESQVSTKRSSS